MHEMMIQSSLITTALIALFWFTWKINGEEVPEINAIQFLSDWKYTLPFSVSRWWDILIGIFWPPLFVWISVMDLYKGDEPLFQGLTSGTQRLIAISIGTGLCGGLFFGILFGIILTCLFLLFTAILSTVTYILLKTIIRFI